MDNKSLERSISAIAARLTITREAFGLKQGEFSARAGIGQATYNQYESAKRRPSLEEAQKLVDEYNITLDWIYNGNPSGLPHHIASMLKSKVA